MATPASRPCIRPRPGYIRVVALIKGSKVNQAGSVVVQGDQLIQEEAKAPVRARPRSPVEPYRTPDPVIIGGTPPNPMAVPDHEVVAYQYEPEADQGPDADTEYGPSGSQDDGYGAGDLGSALETTVAAAEPATHWSDTVSTADDLVERWDTARDSMLEEARSQADFAAEQAMGEAPSPADVYDELYQESATRVAQALGDSSEAEGAIDAIVPALERQAAARAELEAAAASRARWRELAGAEEQIAALLSNFEFSDGAAQKALGDREQLLAAARLEAARILGEAQEEAARLRADAETQGAQALEDFELTRQERFEQLREEARAAGYTEGRAQADEEGARIVEEAIETLNRSRLAYPKAVRENQEKLIGLALQVAEKIIGEEITARPDIVVKTLDFALTRVTDMESVTIRVNPEDLALVQSQEERYRDLLAQVKKLEFVSSPKIQRGGVFIETSSGTVDATIKTQLSVIAEVFRNLGKELEDVDDTESEAFEELN